MAPWAPTESRVRDGPRGLCPLHALPLVAMTVPATCLPGGPLLLLQVIPRFMASDGLRLIQ